MAGKLPLFDRQPPGLQDAFSRWDASPILEIVAVRFFIRRETTHGDPAGTAARIVRHSADYPVDSGGRSVWRAPTSQAPVDHAPQTRLQSGVTLHQQFGDIDIYLFDQLLRGRIAPGMRVLDAGCGTGRNLVYLMRAGYEVFGVDSDPVAIEHLRARAAELAPHLPASNFRHEPLERLSFPPGFADVVISSAVLHFARNDEQFTALLHASWNALRVGGLFFCRLASTIGMEDRVQQVAGRRHRLPDGSERYLVDANLLMTLTGELAGELVDPIKTTVVHDQRCMTTWVVCKRQRVA